LPGDASDLEILAYEQSPLGMICLRQRGIASEPGAVVTEITLDHQFLMSSHNTASERALARIGLELHGGCELEVLVGGLGLGYTAREVLRCERVARVEVVELLAPVIGWLERGLVPLAAELRADARFAVCEGDVYGRLANPPERRHDLILIDVDHSPDEHLGAGSASFYTEAGLELARRHLADRGVLGVWSYAESSPFAAALRRVFREVSVESVCFENPVALASETNWLFFARG
jgi:spermidine synthase